MPKGYWIARIDAQNPERYKDYVETARPAFEEYGAKFLVRGGEHHAVEGAARARNVVIEFPTLQAALDCHASAQYQKAAAIRQEVAEGEIVIVAGHDA
ncbi:DUF1330 domain-containing protein [Aurantimonas sp. MSK8Z-1]|uniref:DUF1330 domain-containing protein n=1 Tax=Mangrovibrevibacter kandeliae TaxID=2968473 RepID=UPI0021191604|nr:DUF1330 domain-containing protein [Aurantimonas sp. MSK8Z-1]MCW4115113.1 DUF1330 domain-containing protein [Aurantimonas sp. MSK8Z-1]